MSKMSQNTLSDLNQFLKYSQTSDINPANRPKIKKQTPKTTEAELISQNENESETVLQSLEKLSQKTGIPTENLLSNLMHQNTAQESLENFVINDLKMKGALLLLHYQLLLQEAERKVIHSQEL
jgi:hypothetical protein